MKDSAYFAKTYHTDNGEIKMEKKQQLITDKIFVEWLTTCRAFMQIKQCVMTEHIKVSAQNTM